MNTFASVKKKLIVLVLAAAMAVSVLAGGLFFIDASAATDPAAPADLFTASEGVNVLPKSQYVTGANAAVGDFGIRFQSPNDEAFTVELNGVFHRSFGLDWSAPADGFLSGSTADVLAEVVFEIAEFGNPDNKFEIHYAGYWQSSAWVEYDYTNAEGQTETLYRTYGLGYQTSSRMVYSKEIIDGSVNSPDGSDILFLPTLTSSASIPSDKRQQARTELRVQKSVSNDDSATTAEEGAIINVVGCSSSGSTVQIASFRDEPVGFSPTDEAMEVYAEKQWWDPSGDANAKIGYNLPRINFDNGYTVKIHVSKGLEFMVHNVAEAFAEGWTAEPWYAFGTQNGSYPVQQFDLTGDVAENISNVGTDWADKNVTPLFYQNWQEVPHITVEEHAAVVSAGTVTPPAATYATNGNPTATTDVTDIQYRLNEGNWVAVPEGGIPDTKIGDEIDVQYSTLYGTIPITETIHLSVRNVPENGLAAESAVRAQQGVQVTANGQGVSGTDTTSENGLLLHSTEQTYVFDVVGRFTGNTELRWGTAADEGWAVNGRVEFTIAEAGNPENYFKVIWISPSQSRAYVEYVYNGQTLYCAQGRNNSGTYYYVLGDGSNHDNDEIADNYDVQYRPWVGDASSSGVLGLEWEGDVLKVMATNESGSKQVLAAFENDTNGFTAPTGATGTKSNLPKISFANGYTVSVKVTGAIDFLLYDVTTEEDDTSFAATTLAYEPLWYTRGAAMPVFTMSEFLGVQFAEGNTKVTVPQADYTAGEGASLAVTWGKAGESGTDVTNENELTVEAAGTYVLCYTVTVDEVAYTHELTVHVCDYSELVSGDKPICTQGASGLYACACEPAYTLERELPADPSAHSMEYHEKVDATCTQEGTIEYWECEYCHKYFKDAEGSEQVTDLSIPKTDHVYGEPVWSWDGYASATATFTCTAAGCGDQQTETATITSEETQSTCTEAGKRVYTAKVTFDKTEYTNKKEETLPLAAHKLTAVEAKPATCTEAGNIGYWECSVCHKYFNDAEGKTEITDKDSVTIAAAHKLTAVAAKPATCTEEGNTAYWECSVCHKYFEDEKGEKEITDKTSVTVEKTGHTMVKVDAKPATCTEDGNTAYYKCSECGWCSADKVHGMDESATVLKATGHTFEDGVCTKCGAEDPDYEPEPEPQGLSGGAIAGIVIAVVAVGCAAVAVVIIIRKKKGVKKNEKE